MAEESSTKKIIISIESKGNPELKALADRMGSLNTQVSKMSGTLSSLKSSFTSLFAVSIAGVGIRQIGSMADAFINLESRITSLSGSSKDTRSIMGQLLQVANDTKAPIDNLADVYARLAASTKELHLSSGALVSISEVLQNTFRLSGANAQEAANASVQFSQAMALGVLRGQDLKSVLSQNAEIGNVLSKSLGVTRGEILKMAEAGMLTSTTVLKALAQNMDDVNGRAAGMAQTFEQSLIIAMNNLKFKLGELNSEFDLNGKFAKGIQFVTENLETLSILIGVLALTKIPALVSSLTVATTALIAFAATPIGAIVIALGAAVAYLGLKFKDISLAATAFASLLTVGMAKAQQAIYGLSLAFYNLIGVQNKHTEGIKGLIDEQEGLIKNTREYYLEQKRESQLAAAEIKIRSILDKQRAKEEILNLKNAAVALDGKTVLLSRLNKEYDSGAISASQYFDKLEKATDQISRKEFIEGKKNLAQYNEELRKHKELSIARDLNDGTISLQQFNAAIEANQLKKLDNELQSGKISLIAYNEELTKISTKFDTNSVLVTGASNYIKGIGTLSSQIAGFVTSTFTHLEDAFVAFTQNGKFNFKDFTQAVLDDLNRIIIRSLIIKPLAEGLLNFALPSGPPTPGVGGGGAGGSSASPTAFASGGVINSPISFGIGRGKMGIAGEAGPEAILPLQKTGSGDLGVKATTSPVYVNIVNQSGGEVQQRESTGAGGEKILEILIQGKVKEGIAGGAFDRSFQQAFGLNRKGS